MKKDLKKRWVEALRSGDYEQGDGALCRIYGDNALYCCLGVLVELVRGEDVWEKIPNQRWLIPRAASIGDTAFPSSTFLDSVGLKTEFADEVAHKNDFGHSFEEIADWIEENI